MICTLRCSDPDCNRDGLTAPDWLPPRTWQSLQQYLNGDHCTRALELALFSTFSTH